jgi:hypothetical protein
MRNAWVVVVFVSVLALLPGCWRSDPGVDCEGPYGGPCYIVDAPTIGDSSPRASDAGAYDAGAYDGAGSDGGPCAIIEAPLAGEHYATDLRVDVVAATTAVTANAPTAYVVDDGVDAAGTQSNPTGPATVTALPDGTQSSIVWWFSLPPGTRDRLYVTIGSCALQVTFFTSP